jgi:hypothetical protein
VVEEEEPFPGLPDGDLPYDDTPEDDLTWDEEEEIPGDEDSAEEVPGEEDTEETGKTEEPDEAEESVEEAPGEGELGETEAPGETDEGLWGEETPEDFWEEPGDETDADLAPEREPLEEPSPEETGPGTSPEVAEQAEPEAAEQTEPVRESIKTGEPEPAESDSQEKQKKAKPGDDLLGLMKFLKSMTGALPDRDRESFMQSDARLSMEYIIDTLEGRKGLIRDIEQRRKAGSSAVPAGAPAFAGTPGSAAATFASAAVSGSSSGAPVSTAAAASAPVPPGSGPPLSRMAALRNAPSSDTGKPRKKHSVQEMLNFLAQLAGSLPDPHLGKAINRKVNTVIMEMEPEKRRNDNAHG